MYICIYLHVILYISIRITIIKIFVVSHSCFDCIAICWTSFHVAAGHLYVSFGIMFIQVFCPFFFGFWGPHLQHMEVPRLGVRTGATAAGPPHNHSNARSEMRCVWDLHHSSLQWQIINPLNETRDGTRVLRDTSLIVSTKPQGELLPISGLECSGF